MADINPLRYRGYYYDQETKLYHLWSRYYDPQTCRFINADGLASTGQGILGSNMFAYCNNNPIAYLDKTGNFLNTAIGAVVGGVIGALNAWANGDDVLSGALIGAGTGALAGAAADIAIATGGVGAVVIAAVGGAVSGGLNTGLTDVANGRDVNWTNVAIDSVTGAIGGMLTFGTGEGSLKKVGGNIVKNMIKNTTESITKGTTRQIGNKVVKYAAKTVAKRVAGNIAFEFTKMLIDLTQQATISCNRSRYWTALMR